MPVLVDTVVWVRSLAGKWELGPFLEDLLTKGEVIGHQFVYGELLMGGPGGRMELFSDYRLMSWATLVPHSELEAFVRTRRLHGRGIGWVDAHLLASALVDSLQFWTADPRLHAVARELGIAYEPPQ